MISERFDSITDLFDETRRALDKHTLQGMKEMLTRHQCHSILEIDVGTARVALPLAANGFDITGLDLSKRMMEKALAKGIEKLILADASRVPLKEKSFDATLMAHIFHLLPDPLSVMREAAKISRVGVFALVRKRSDDGEGSNRPFFFSLLESAEEYDVIIKKLPGTASERLEKIIAKLLELRRERPGYYQLLYQLLSDDKTPKEIRGAITRKGTLFRSELRKLIVEGQRSGTIADDDPDQLLEAVMGVIEGLWRRMAYDPESTVKNFPNSSIILRMLKPDKRRGD